MKKTLWLFVLLLSVWQWSWAGVHVAMDEAQSASHAQNQLDPAVDNDSEPASDCCAQLHCSQTHCIALPEIATAFGADTPKQAVPSNAVNGTRASLPSEIERPKWVTNGFAVVNL